MNDIEQRFVDLSDVVEERDLLDDAPLGSIELQRVGENECIGRDSADMRPRV